MLSLTSVGLLGRACTGGCRLLPLSASVLAAGAPGLPAVWPAGAAGAEPFFAAAAFFATAAAADSARSAWLPANFSRSVVTSSSSMILKRTSGVPILWPVRHTSTTYENVSPTSVQLPPNSSTQVVSENTEITRLCTCRNDGVGTRCFRNEGVRQAQSAGCHVQLLGYPGAG